MPKAIVFDLGGTLMEFAGMPLNWSDYYIGGFENFIMNTYSEKNMPRKFQMPVSKLCFRGFRMLWEL